MELVDQICSVILAVGSVLVFYKVIYQILGFILPAKRYPNTDKRFSYAFVIAARNEALVIPHLIESIRHQDNGHDTYPIFVVADNCTDNTAEICRSLGAIVYERFDQTKARKGYALQYLFHQIERDFGIDFVDGYFFFDADNLLAPNYVTEMNKVFALDYKMVTSYRNTKNFDTNFISSAYGIHFYRTSVSSHRPRSILGLATHLTGTGYMFSSELLIDGWHATSLTEDAEHTMRFTAKGYSLAYCEAAEFYDEQPTDFKTVYKQRIRWTKGHLQNFAKESGQLLKRLFKRVDASDKRPLDVRFRERFMCYDMFFKYFPYALFSLVIGGIYPLISLIYGVMAPGRYDYSHMLWNIILYFATFYLGAIVNGTLTVIRERKHVRCSLPKLILYVLCFPWFDLISVPLMLIALVKDVDWKPIPHEDSRSIKDLLQ